jgi:hypothetical protein
MNLIHYSLLPLAMKQKQEYYNVSVKLYEDEYQISR